MPDDNDKQFDDGYPLVPAIGATLAEMDRAVVRHITDLPVTADMDQFWHIREWTKQLANYASAWKKMITEKWIESMQEQGVSEVVIGSIRYYIGTTKTYKVKDKADLLEALLNHTGGDFDAIVECLSSNAFKHGAVRKQFEDEQKFDQHFEQDVVRNIKDGSPKRGLQEVNDDFVR
tara:strand:- start:915 stop:1442 length:528 start_codon:yes stop_codon:yes gene_type:complete